jgi:hypothetical protein
MMARGTTIIAAPAQPLHKTPGDQPFHIGGKGTNHGSHEENPDAGIKRRLAPGLIGPRAVDQLRQAKGDEIGRDRGLHRGYGGSQRRADIGQGGEIHVDGEGADAGEKPKDESGAQDAIRHEKACG